MKKCVRQVLLHIPTCYKTHIDYTGVDPKLNDRVLLRQVIHSLQDVLVRGKERRGEERRGKEWTKTGEPRQVTGTGDPVSASPFSLGSTPV